ncbi:chromatin assembly factor 1 subunit A-domain-containing protein [Favolaschia claudopus]|uniref:Chromatin assembly factor 1 subunit A-domain-containing protein n=1 Tax=Favolaschia claudopus TaxID=2862362 RepID=A0AAW0AQ27_9AGAR
MAASTHNNDAASAKACIVDIKNGKVIFKQKPISFEKHSETLQEIVKFRELLEARSTNKEQPLTSIPEEYRCLIAKLVHESDKTLSALSKHILQELLPAQDDDEDELTPPLTLHAVETGIKSVANRNNYGLDGLPGVKPPATLCVWRWEVKSVHLDWLPKNAREKADNRMSERAQAKLDLKSLLDALPKAEQDTMLDPKGTASGRAAAKDATGGSTSQTIDLTEDAKSASQTAKQKENEENETISASKVGRPKKIIDSDKAAKEKDKQEKKAAKAEREQKEKDAQSKAQSFLQGFLKAGKSSRPSPVKVQASSGSTSSNISEFHKTFKPFVVKKDTTLAPVNWFRGRVKSPQLTYEGDVIVIDDERGPNDVDVASMSPKEILQSALANLPASPELYSLGKHGELAPGSSRTQLKTGNTVTVRDLVARLNEAEVAGDVNLVRSLLNQLSDREIVPAKILIFADDARPGYFGTWTRDSRIIGPRTPLARDVAVFDYGYDSGEEWEEEPAGDAEDVVDDGEDEDGELDDADSDLDSWLVDDDEEPPSPVMSRGGSPTISTLPKRKAEAEDARLTKKRKVVVPLIPFGKGPSWEQSIGHCEHDMFNAYRIQFFNDTPFPIDPFTFVSQGTEAARAAKKDVFAVPSLPDRLLAASAASDSSAAAQPGTAAPKRAAPGPKTAFPDIHLGRLLDKIATSATASLPILIDTIYQDLKDHKVKKNSIEAKVREVAEKCKVKKVWIVKDSFRAPMQGPIQVDARC